MLQREQQGEAVNRGVAGIVGVEESFERFIQNATISLIELYYKPSKRISSACDDVVFEI